jgi:phosphatidylserine/phosphatidylglycerophosphate/cardiolipin synthase-like enzyme
MRRISTVTRHIAAAKTASNGYIPANKLALLHSGSDYFDLLERYIAQAQQEIHLQFYIFNDDQAGKRLLVLRKQKKVWRTLAPVSNAVVKQEAIFAAHAAALYDISSS